MLHINKRLNAIKRFKAGDEVIISRPLTDEERDLVYNSIGETSEMMSASELVYKIESIGKTSENREFAHITSITGYSAMSIFLFQLKKVS